MCCLARSHLVPSVLWRCGKAVRLANNKQFFRLIALLVHDLINQYQVVFIYRDFKAILSVVLDKGVCQINNTIIVNIYTYLNVESSLSHFSGVKAFLLLKSLWNSVGGIFGLLFHFKILIFWLIPETRSTRCERLHLWPSHMTSISHTSCFTQPSAVSCSDWLIFLAVNHVISSAAFFSFHFFIKLHKFVLYRKLLVPKPVRKNGKKKK